MEERAPRITFFLTNGLRYCRETLFQWLAFPRSNDFAEAKLAEWWDFAGHIWAKFGRYVVTYNETEIGGEDAAGQAYPM